MCKRYTWFTDVLFNIPLMKSFGTVRFCEVSSYVYFWLFRIRHSTINVARLF